MRLNKKPDISVRLVKVLPPDGRIALNAHFDNNSLDINIKGAAIFYNL